MKTFANTLVRLLVVAGMFALYQFADVIVMLPNMFAQEFHFSLSPIYGIILFLCIIPLLFYLLFVTYRLWLKKDNPGQYGRQRFNGRIALIVFIGFVSLFGVQVLNGMIAIITGGGNSANQETIEVLFKQMPFLIGLIVVVEGPLIEEYIFRGLLMNSFAHQDRVGWVFASGAVSASVFGLIHTGFAEPLAWLTYAMMGAIFAGVYAFTKDIRYSILLHFLNNGIVTLMMFAQVN